MVKKFLISGALGLAICITSCNKKDDIETLVSPATQSEINDDQYIHLELTLSGENSLGKEDQDLRTFFYLASNLPKFKFGNNGDKVKVRTQISKMIDLGSTQRGELLYDAILDWTVANNGTRLVYQGNDVKILRSKLTNTDKLTLLARVINKNTPTTPKRFTQTPLKEITTNQTALDIEVPYVLGVDLERTGTNGQQLSPMQGVQPKFYPLGELAFFSVKNTGDANVTFTGLKGTGLSSIEGLEYIDDPLGVEHDKGLLLNTINEITGEVNPTITINNVTISPNQTKYFVFWRCDFYDVMGGPIKPSNFLKATFAQDVTINYPGSANYQGGNNGILMKWQVEVHNKTESGSFHGDGVDFE